MDLIQKISGYFVQNSHVVVEANLPADQKTQGVFAMFLSQKMSSLSSKKFHFAIAGLLILTTALSIYTLWNKGKGKRAKGLPEEPITGLEQSLKEDTSVAHAKAVLLKIIREKKLPQERVIEEASKLKLTTLIELNEHITKLLPTDKSKGLASYRLLSTLLQQVIEEKANQGATEDHMDEVKQLAENLAQQAQQGFGPENEATFKVMLRSIQSLDLQALILIFQGEATSNPQYPIPRKIITYIQQELRSRPQNP